MPSANLIVGDDSANTLNGTAGRDVIYGWDPEGPQGNVNSISATRVASGLTQPLFAGAPPGDLERLFIVEKGGAIKILDLDTQQVLPTAFLDVSSQILTEGEQGLLGMTFDPNFVENGYFYVNLINSDGDTEIRRYQVSAEDPNQADPDSATLIIKVDQPAGRTNHKAGWLGFGPDGYLYAALGDGGGSGDPNANGQNIDVLLGKMLRLDVSADDFPADPDRNYAIPADNPFVGVAGADEIYALGLRNPWRDSFDRGLGDLYIADVGQNDWEEINLGQLGGNYQWDIKEGPADFDVTTPNGGGVWTDPIHAYDHGVGRSISGGYVYRGTAEGLHGHYFFADLNGKMFTLHFDGSDWVAEERTAQIATDVGSIDTPVSFGEDGAGNLYVVDIAGEVFRLTPNVASADVGDTLAGGGGDDLIFGGSGNDVLKGGLGDDELQGGNGNDTLAGAGGDDLLIAGAGQDLMNGGAGADVAAGGTGNDRYVVDHLDDRIVERAGEGIDKVIAVVSGYTLAAHVETGVVRVATGATLTGGDTDNLLIGGAGDDALDGGGGNDVLNGKAGANTLAGGQGDDTFFVGGIGDVVDEAANGGHDRVLSAVSYQLSAGSEVEVLRTDDPTGVGAISLMGNEFGQTMQGNAGTNGLNGLGGPDVMQGLGGDDTYWVDNAADRTVEAAGGGFDRVLASVSYALQAGREIEVLRTTNPGGVTAIDLTGNEMAQTMQGNAGANRLDGMAGNDVLQGLGGPDTFVFADGYDVDTAADYQAGVDQFDLTGVAGLDSYADLQALMNQVGANVVINFGGGDVLRILNITVATLDANPGDFVV